MDDETDWITAHNALEKLCATGFSATMAMHTICERAHAGLIRSKAELFKFDNKESRDLEIPNSFWWARGREALKQNWRSGDFSTWLNNTNHLQAFGVSFSLLDLENIASSKPSAPSNLILTDEDLRIEKKLKTISETAALSWRQAVFDLKDENRVSFRGPALEMRESFREVLEKMAPDNEVERFEGYIKEPGQDKPTRRQKVRYILKARGKSSGAATEDAIEAFEQSITQLCSSVYNLSSQAVHVAKQREQVNQVRRYLVAVFHEVLGI